MLSIIIPFYNTAAYIERCLQSVVSQTYQVFEIILVDDSSTDDGLSRVENFLRKTEGIKYKIYSNKENKGQSASRNTGLSLSEGDYILFLDSDDELANTDSLQILMNNADSGYDFIYGIQQYSYNDNVFEIIPFHKANPPKKMMLNESEVFNALLDKKITISPCNIIYNKQFFKKNNLKFEEGFFYEDELWTFQVCYFANKALLLDSVTYNYFQGNLQSTTKNFTEKHIESAEEIIKKILSFCEKENVYQKANIKKIIRYVVQLCYWFLNNSQLYQDKNNWKSVYRSFKKSYKSTQMNNEKKHFRWSPTFSYFILKQKMRESDNKNSFFYQKILNRLNIV